MDSPPAPFRYLIDTNFNNIQQSHSMFMIAKLLVSPLYLVNEWKYFYELVAINHQQVYMTMMTLRSHWFKGLAHTAMAIEVL